MQFKFEKKLGGGGAYAYQTLPSNQHPSYIFSGLFDLFYSIKHIKHYECRFQKYSPFVIPCRF